VSCVNIIHNITPCDKICGAAHWQPATSGKHKPQAQKHTLSHSRQTKKINFGLMAPPRPGAPLLYRLIPVEIQNIRHKFISSINYIIVLITVETTRKNLKN